MVPSAEEGLRMLFVCPLQPLCDAWGYLVKALAYSLRIIVYFFFSSKVRGPSISITPWMAVILNSQFNLPGAVQVVKKLVL